MWRIISSLPINKSPGPDKIHTWVYRDCLPVILGPLTEIINSSLESAKYPGSIPSCQIACLSPTESLRGEILSPLLFCIYLNDLPCAPQVCGLESYVDDSKIFLPFSLPDVDTAIANLEQDLQHVAAWCCENQLLINPDKTKFMLIATRQLRKRFFSSPVGKSLEPVASEEGFGCYPGLSPHIWLSYFQRCVLLYGKTMPDQSSKK